MHCNIHTSQTSIARSGCQRNGFMRLLLIQSWWCEKGNFFTQWYSQSGPRQEGWWHLESLRWPVYRNCQTELDFLISRKATRFLCLQAVMFITTCASYRLEQWRQEARLLASLTRKPNPSRTKLSQCSIHELLDHVFIGAKISVNKLKKPFRWFAPTVRFHGSPIKIMVPCLEAWSGLGLGLDTS